MVIAAYADDRWDQLCEAVEFGWAVGFSYLGMPEEAQPVRNVWAGNMAIRYSVFEAIGGFREDFGKVGSVPRPEDTDVCLRAAGGRGIWLYEPTADVGQWIPSQRTTLRYFARRCFHEGQRKAAQAALDGTRESTATERSYTRRILPHGILLGLRDAARGDVWGAARAAAIALGFASTAAGFAAGSMTGINRALPDGYADFHSRAMPLLDQHGCTATLFVTTGWVQDADMRLAAPGRMLNWTQITEAADAGVEIGAHTRRHPQLGQLPQKLVREELYTSKQWLESKLGLPVPGLAYPFGYSSARVRAMRNAAH